MSRRVYIAGEAVEDQDGMVQVKLDTGFGDPVLAVGTDKLVDLSKLAPVTVAKAPAFVTACLAVLALGLGACAGAPRQTQAQVTDQQGRAMLTVEAGGKMTWHAKRDAVARAMLGAIVDRDARIRDLEAKAKSCPVAKPTKVAK